MSLSNNFPVNSSNLNLSLANAGRLDPRVTFTRASTGTYYDGYSSAKAEENLFLQSQDFTTTWAPSATTVSANTVAAPDGTTTADTIVETTATGSHNVYQSLNVTSGLPYTFSVFVKKGDGVSARNFVQLGFQNAQFGSNSYANFDISGGTVTVTGAGLTSASITSAGNNWWRCSIVDTATSSASTSVIVSLITTSTGANQESYTGTTDANIFLWGAQLEQRSSVTAYTATTTATITNYIPVLQTAAADVPRFDHNPTTRAALGLLVEEQRANLQTYSADFANAAWTKSNSTITSNTIVAPDGTLTGDKLVENTSTTSHSVRQSPSATASSVHTLTVYAKAGERSVIALEVVDGGATGNGFSAYFNLATSATSNVVNFGNGSGASASITAVGNSWYRCSLSGIANTSGTSLRCNIFVAQAAGSVSYTGDGYSGVFLWGAQLETGAFPTSYIATTTASVTRNADVASMTGGNFGWYNQAAGTFVVQASKEFASNGAIFEGSDGSTFSGFTLNTNSWSGVTGTRLDWVNRTATLANGAPFFPGTVSATALGIIAAALTSTETVLVRNGVIATDTSASTQRMPVNSIFIGSRIGSTFMHNGTIRTIRYYPVRNSNAQLQALTG